MVHYMSKHFPKTRHTDQAAKGATPGYALLERAGFVRSSGSAGIFSLPPLGWRTHQRVCEVIFEEMETAGVLNVQLPVLQARELWEKTKRWKAYIENMTMFTTMERHGGTEFGLAPTAEEVVTALVAAELRSWRELPLYLHQIGPKFRDEVRPRLGLLRAREFGMSDAYSFDRDEDGMRESFDFFRSLYERIFERLGLETISVQADSGPIGGSGSAEFMTVSDAGEDTLLVCDRCDYGANAEKADSRYPEAAVSSEEHRDLRLVETPGITTVAALRERFPEISPTRMVKTLLFTDTAAEYDENLVAVCVRGDLDVNEVKLANAIKGTGIPAAPEQIERATGARVGFAGPIRLENVSKILFDHSVEGMRNFLCGANRTDVHALDANFGRDVPVPHHYVDVHVAEGGHGCPECSGSLSESRGIEVGHIFQLQQSYAEALGASYLTAEGNEATPWLGCYGIGTTRVMQAIAESSHDDDGLVWPASVAPYEVYVVPAGRTAEVAAVTHDVVEALEGSSLGVIVDDRGGSAGKKFKDADLIGCPVRVTVGRRASEGVVEVRRRSDGDEVEVEVGSLEVTVRELLGATRGPSARSVVTR
jgi:prolyl-tRNA synthetase